MADADDVGDRAFEGSDGGQRQAALHQGLMEMSDLDAPTAKCAMSELDGGDDDDRA